MFFKTSNGVYSSDSCNVVTHIDSAAQETYEMVEIYNGGYTARYEKIIQRSEDIARLFDAYIILRENTAHVPETLYPDGSGSKPLSKALIECDEEVTAIYGAIWRYATDGSPRLTSVYTVYKKKEEF